MHAITWISSHHPLMSACIQALVLYGVLHGTVLGRVLDFQLSVIAKIYVSYDLKRGLLNESRKDTYKSLESTTNIEEEQFALSCMFSLDYHFLFPINRAQLCHILTYGKHQ